MSDSLRPRGLQPTRLLRPWDPPGKNTGVGCHFLLQERVTAESRSPIRAGPPLPVSLWRPPPRQPGGITQRKPRPCCGCKHPYLPDDSTWPTLLRLHLKLVQKNPPGKPHGGWKLTMFKTRSRPPRLPCVLRLRTVCNITAKGDTARNRKRHGSVLRL